MFGIGPADWTVVGPYPELISPYNAYMSHACCVAFTCYIGISRAAADSDTCLLPQARKGVCAAWARRRCAVCNTCGVIRNCASESRRCYHRNDTALPLESCASLIGVGGGEVGLLYMVVSFPLQSVSGVQKLCTSFMLN